MKSIITDTIFFYFINMCFDSYIRVNKNYIDNYKYDFINTIEFCRLFLNFLYILAVTNWNYDKTLENNFENLSKQIENLQNHINVIECDLYKYIIDVREDVSEDVSEDAGAKESDESEEVTEVISPNVATGPTRAFLRSTETTELSN